MSHGADKRAGTADIIYHRKHKNRFAFCRKDEPEDSKAIHQVVDGAEFRKLKESRWNKLCPKCDAVYNDALLGEYNHAKSVELCDVTRSDTGAPLGRTGCGETLIHNDRMKYCPYCGKKFRRKTR